MKYPESIIGSTSQNALPPVDNEAEGAFSSSYHLNFEPLGNAVAAQMEMSLKLLGSSPSTIKNSFSAASELMNEFSAIAKERDE